MMTESDFVYFKAQDRRSVNNFRVALKIKFCHLVITS